MGGLLYKDFIACFRMQKVNTAWLMVIITAAFILFRILFPGSNTNPNLVLTNEAGEVVTNIPDIFFAIMLFMLIFVCFLMVSSFADAIVLHDEKNKIKNYINAMPLEKHSYVASKYIFVGILTYVILSIEYVWCIVCKSFCVEGVISDMVELLTSSVSMLSLMGLFLVAIQLPFLLTIGNEAATLIKITLLTLAIFAIMGYVFFGDMSFLDNWDLINVVEMLAKWVDHHKTEVLIVQFISPILVLGFYYLSYLISCKLVDRKER